MIDVDLVDRLKVDGAAQLRLVSIHVVGERALEAIEHEPTLVPRLELLAHLKHVAAARVRVDEHERLLGVRVELIDELVAAVLDVLSQVKVVVPNRQVARKWSSLFFIFTKSHFTLKLSFIYEI